MRRLDPVCVQEALDAALEVTSVLWLEPLDPVAVVDPELRELCVVPVPPLVVPVPPLVVPVVSVPPLVCCVVVPVPPLVPVPVAVPLVPVRVPDLELSVSVPVPVSVAVCVRLEVPVPVPPEVVPVPDAVTVRDEERVPDPDVPVPVPVSKELCAVVVPEREALEAVTVVPDLLRELPVLLPELCDVRVPLPLAVVLPLRDDLLALVVAVCEPLPELLVAVRDALVSVLDALDALDALGRSG